VLILADAIIALVAVALVYLYTVDAVRVWHIYAGMFIRAITDGFQWPAMQASTSLMVPEKHLTRVAGLNQTLRGAMNIVAPPMGALLLSLMPLQSIMAIDVGSAALAIICLFFVHIPQPESQAPDATSEEREPSLWQNMREGWHYMWNWPGLVAVGVIATVLNFLLNPAFSLLPLLVTNHFHGEAIHLGWLESAWGVGMVLGGLILGVWGGFRRRVFTSLMGIVGMGVGVLIVGLVPGETFWLALAALFLAGLMNPMANGPLFAIVSRDRSPTC
jgi:DHA3 family macrolide efflux protein-like MFS transporter